MYSKKKEKIHHLTVRIKTRMNFKINLHLDKEYEFQFKTIIIFL